MNKRLRIKTFVFVIVIVTALAGCTPNQNSGNDKETEKEEMPPEEIISQIGTVKFIDIEGGFYGIMGADGEKYDPVNLGEEFKKDGIKVEFKAKLKKDVATIRMWGTPVELLKIKKIE